MQKLLQPTAGGGLSAALAGGLPGNDLTLWPIVTVGLRHEATYWVPPNTPFRVRRRQSSAALDVTADNAYNHIAGNAGNFRIANAGGIGNAV